MRIFVITKRTLIIAAIIFVCIVAAVIIALSFTEGSATAPTTAATVEEYELTVMAGRKKELPVYSVSRDDKKIALTIDAAWEDDKTDFILETLEQYKVKATFFLCGFWVEKYPDKVKAIYEAGHEVGNHTATHPHMTRLNASQMQDELNKYEELLMPITGQKTNLFRAPYGEYNDNVIKTVRDMGYEVVQWDIDTVDWRPERSAQTILDTVLPNLKSGSIILCHNNGYMIKDYLPTLLKTAIDQGYVFVPVSELLLKGDTIIDVNGVQKPA